MGSYPLKTEKLFEKHAVCSDSAPDTIHRRFSTAPMMGWSDRHCRSFWRCLSQHSVVYTEMVTASALLFSGKSEQFLSFNSMEHPIALQVGGSVPDDLAECARLAEQYGYDEINLNVGCPSDRVQNHKIGACLMSEPELVRDCLASMQKVVSIPVTIKHRIGIDHISSYAHLKRFVEIVAESGCRVFIVHARNAILKGLSPKQNREIPPLRYEFVHQLKQDFPHLEIIVNGGLSDWESINTQLQYVDGVMLGREVYQNPWLLAEVDKNCYQSSFRVTDRFTVIDAWRPYIAEELAKGTDIKHLLRHTLGLFNGQPGAKAYRRFLSEHMHQPGVGLEVLDSALEQVSLI